MPFALAWLRTDFNAKLVPLHQLRWKGRIVRSIVTESYTIDGIIDEGLPATISKLTSFDNRYLDLLNLLVIFLEEYLIIFLVGNFAFFDSMPVLLTIRIQAIFTPFSLPLLIVFRNYLFGMRLTTIGIGASPFSPDS